MNRLTIDGYPLKTHRVGPSIDTRIDLALYELESLGLWLEAESAQQAWDRGKPYMPAYDVPLPLWLRQEMGSLNVMLDS